MHLNKSRSNRWISTENVTPTLISEATSSSSLKNLNTIWPPIVRLVCWQSHPKYLKEYYAQNTFCTVRGRTDPCLTVCFQTLPLNTWAMPPACWANCEGLTSTINWQLSEFCWKYSTCFYVNVTPNHLIIVQFNRILIINNNNKKNYYVERTWTILIFCIHLLAWKNS